MTIRYIKQRLKQCLIKQDIIQTEQKQTRLGETHSLLIDSFPVELAKQGHRFKACVAPELANHGYCSTNMSITYLYVVEKLSLLANEELFGDKAYQRPDAKEVEQNQNLRVLTPVKKKKGQKYLDADEQWLSTLVSTVRQPIESLFGWIEEKTGIECARKVRSYQGLLVHVFGRLAAAMFFWNKLRICS